MNAVHAGRYPVGKVKVAMGQMLVEGGNIPANIRRAEQMIADSGKTGSDIIVLPECIDLGWTYPDACNLAEPVPGTVSDSLCEAAVQSGMHVVAGLTEKEGTHIYNTALLISSRGEILGKHRKINILDIAQDIYSTGTSLSVIETQLGKIGVDICADNFPDTYAIGHTLARMGADIILSPCSWAIPPDYSGNPNPCWMWEKSFTRLACLFNIPVVGVSNVGIISAGVWKDYHCIGNSLAVSGEGIIVKKGERTSSDQSLFTVEFDLAGEKPRGTDISLMLKEKGFSFS